MIPKEKLPKEKFNPDGVAGIPCIHTLEHEGGLMDNHYYASCFLVEWERVKLALKRERKFLARIDAVATDRRTFELAITENLNTHGLEYGVAALTLALSAAGCATGTSCRGHEERQVPTVVSWADKKVAAKLYDMFKDGADVAFYNEKFEGINSMKIQCSSIEIALRVASLIYERREEFAEIKPEPKKCDCIDSDTEIQLGGHVVAVRVDGTEKLYLHTGWGVNKKHMLAVRGTWEERECLDNEIRKATMTDLTKLEWGK